MTKVTIIVAIYKSEKFLPKLIESIISQTYPNLEIILVDDGSPDRSGEICDKYAEQDARIRVIHKKNGGACEARNVGLETATGEWVSIIDGDDWLEPDYIEYLLNLAESTNSDMAMTDKIFTTRDRMQTAKDCVETWSAERAAGAIIYPCFPIGPWNKLYKRSMIEDNNISFSVPWSGEGLYFSFMAAQYSNHVGVGHRKIYNYRMNNAESGLTHYNVQMGINAAWNIRNIERNIILDSEFVKNAVKWHIWKNCHFLLFLIIATNSKEKYREEYENCLKEQKERFPTVLKTCPFGPKQKIKMTLQYAFPVQYAKHCIRRDKKELEKDLESKDY